MSDTAPPAVAVRSLPVDGRTQRRLVRAWLRERALQTVVTSAVASVVALGLLSDDGFDVVPVATGVVVISACSLVSQRRQLQRHYPVGGLIACGYADDVLRLSLDGVDRLVHLSRVRLLRVRGDMVGLSLLRTRMLLPRELLDDEALAALARGAAAPAPDGGVLGRVSHLGGGVMQPDDAADMRRLTWRLNAYRPLRLAISLLATGFAIGLLVLAHALFGYVLLLGVAGVLLELVAAVARARRGIPQVGSRMVGDVEAGHWVVATATSLTAIPLTQLDHADRYRGLVLLHWRRPVPHTSWPLRLMSEAARTRLGLN